MPWCPEPKKDVAQLRKAPGSRLAGFEPEMSEIGKPTESDISVPRKRRERRKLNTAATKHITDPIEEEGLLSSHS